MIALISRLSWSSPADGLTEFRPTFASMQGEIDASMALATEILHLVKSITKDAHPMDPFRAWDTKRKIQRGCDALLSAILGPLEFTVSIAESCHESQALAFVTSLGLADLIGERQISLLDLSILTAVDPQYLQVTMSCVAARGYFEQINEGGLVYYKNNALSMVLSESHTLSLKNAIGFIGDEAFKAASRLSEAAMNPALSAANIAFGFKGSIFSWMSTPENAWRAQRMGHAMQQLHRATNVHVLDDYEWDKLPSPIVDIGGGIGSLEMSLTEGQKNRDLQFIIFDLLETVEQGVQIWKNSSQVSFVSGNFLKNDLIESNVPCGFPTYVIRHVLHDWADETVVSILKLVHQAMPQHARLIIVEMFLTATSSRLVRTTSMQLLALNNGIVRTSDQIRSLLAMAGFTVQKVIEMRSMDSIIEAVKDDLQ